MYLSFFIILKVPWESNDPEAIRQGEKSKQKRVR